MEIQSRIKQLRKQHHYTQASLAELLGVKPTTVASWEQGRNKPLMDKIQKMSLIFNVPMSDIIGDDTAKADSHASNVIYPQRQNIYHIPIVGEIACGDPITAEENIEGYTDDFFDGHVPDGTLFALRCKGHSMEPTIPDGSLVIIHEQPEVENGEIAAVLVDGDTEATLKRIKYLDKLVMLMPENQQYDPIVLDKEHPGRIIGKAISYSANL